MARPRFLAIIQAGGAGGRMDVLTRERAKPALPFAGVYQLIDFPLSNLTHSGITDVWLSVQYQGASIQEQVVNGRPWDLDRNGGGLRLLMPQQGSGSADEEGFAQGNADELYRIRDQIRNFQPEAVVVMSADHLYRFDYLDAIKTHTDTEAECTIVVTEVTEEDASDHGTVVAAADGKVTGFEYKPDEPTTTTVATEIFVYDPAALLTVVEELQAELTGTSDDGDSGLGDYGESLLPRLVERGRVYAHRLPGYWRDVGQPHHYLAAHQELLTGECDILGDPGWPFLTHQPQRMPARIEATARIEASLLSPGATVAGIVEHSVIGPGVSIDEGAVVRNSVVFSDTSIGKGAQVDWSILDSGCVIGAGAEVADPAARAASDPDQVTLLGQDSRVARNDRIEVGARLEPGTTT